MALLLTLKNTFRFKKNVLIIPKQSFFMFGVVGKQIKNIPSLRYTPPNRTFFSFLRRPTKQQITRKDNMPEGFELIYRNTSERIILVAQVFTTFSTIIIAFMAILQSDFKKSSELPFTDENVFKTRPRETENEILIYVTFFVVTLVTLQYFISQMPQRIYYNVQKQKYWLVFNSNIPFVTKKVPLKVGELRHSPGGISFWKDDRYKTKDGRKLILLESFFRRPADLYIMTGVQRDPNLEDKQ